VMLMAGSWGLLPSDYEKEDPYLVFEPLSNFKIITPVGLGAGFDTDAVTPDSFMRLGFGVVEVGPVMHTDNTANDATADAAAVGARLARLDRSGPLTHLAKLGVTVIGTTTADGRPSLIRAISLVAPHVDYISVQLGAAMALDVQDAEKTVADLVDAVALTPGGGPRVFLRFHVTELAACVSAAATLSVAAQRAGADGVVLCAEEADALYGETVAKEAEWFPRLVEEVYRQVDGKLMLIACGGVKSGRAALACIEAGASGVQISSLLAAEGPQICRRLKNEIAQLLSNEGYVDLHDAVGAVHRKKRGNQQKRKLPSRKGAKAAASFASLT